MESLDRKDRTAKKEIVLKWMEQLVFENPVLWTAKRPLIRPHCRSYMELINFAFLLRTILRPRSRSRHRTSTIYSRSSRMHPNEFDRVRTLFLFPRIGRRYLVIGYSYCSPASHGTCIKTRTMRYFAYWEYFRYFRLLKGNMRLPSVGYFIDRVIWSSTRRIYPHLVSYIRSIVRHMETFPCLDYFSYLSYFLYTLYYKKELESPSIWFRCAFTLSPSHHPRSSSKFYRNSSFFVSYSIYRRSRRITLVLACPRIIQSYPPWSNSRIARWTSISSIEPLDICSNGSRSIPPPGDDLAHTLPPRTLPLT
jgi:hypothetical protein